LRPAAEASRGSKGIANLGGMFFAQIFDDMNVIVIDPSLVVD
jgi:hypothetical protein